jgi:hypothetical protein
MDEISTAIYWETNCDSVHLKRKFPSPVTGAFDMWKRYCVSL